MRALSIDLDDFRCFHANATPNKDLMAFKLARKFVDVWGFDEGDSSFVFDMAPDEIARFESGVTPDAPNFDRRTRVSLVLGIHKALSILFIQHVHRVQWIHNPNAAFAGYTPKEIMCSGAQMGLHDIRKYLDAARQ